MDFKLKHEMVLKRMEIFKFLRENKDDSVTKGDPIDFDEFQRMVKQRLVYADVVEDDGGMYYWNVSITHGGRRYISSNKNVCMCFSGERLTFKPGYEWVEKY